MSERSAILLWGSPADPPIAAVEQALQRIGGSYVLLDQRDALETELTLTVAGELEGALQHKGERVDLATVASVYLRPQDCREAEGGTVSDTEACAGHRTAAVDETLLSWCDLTPARVVNRPCHMAANNSKPFQAAWIESLGFKTPRTLITTDPGAALRFWRKYEKVIYKSVSGVRSIVSRLSNAHAARFDDVASCPTQFQQYVEGREFRAHVIGGTVLACEILSEADDYRYSTEPATMRPCELPAEVAARCARAARSMRLWLAGFDLRRTPEGDWYCFEVNPSPGFTYFEQNSGLPIADSVARMLMSARTKTPCAIGAF